MSYAAFSAAELALAIASADLNQLDDIHAYLIACDLPERARLLESVRGRAAAIRAGVAEQVRAAREHDDLIREALRHLKRD